MNGCLRLCHDPSLMGMTRRGTVDPESPTPSLRPGAERLQNSRGEEQSASPPEAGHLLEARSRKRHSLSEHRQPACSQPDVLNRTSCNCPTVFPRGHMLLATSDGRGLPGGLDSGLGKVYLAPTSRLRRLQILGSYVLRLFRRRTRARVPWLDAAKYTAISARSVEICEGASFYNKKSVPDIVYFFCLDLPGRGAGASMLRNGQGTCQRRTEACLDRRLAPSALAIGPSSRLTVN
jgi:hypothetical protein